MYPLWLFCDRLCFTQCHNCLHYATVFHWVKTQTMVPVLIWSYWPFENKRHLFPVAGQVSTRSHFLVLFTLCGKTAARAQGPVSFRTTSLEEACSANSSTDLAVCKLRRQVFTLSHYKWFMQLKQPKVSKWVIVFNWQLLFWVAVLRCAYQDTQGIAVSGQPAYLVRLPWRELKAELRPAGICSSASVQSEERQG